MPDEFEFEGYPRKIVGVEGATEQDAYQMARRHLVMSLRLRGEEIGGIEGGKVIPLTKPGAFVVVFYIDPVVC